MRPAARCESRGAIRSQCAYAYPASSIAWKNSRQTLQTAGVPPNQGRINRPMMGWTWNSRKALRKIVTGKRTRLTVNRLYHARNW